MEPLSRQNIHQLAKVFEEVSESKASNHEKYLSIHIPKHFGNVVVEATDNIKNQAKIQEILVEIDSLKKYVVDQKDFEVYNQMLDLFWKVIQRDYPNEKEKLKEQLDTAYHKTIVDSINQRLNQVHNYGEKLGLTDIETSSVYTYTTQLYYRMFNAYMRKQEDIFKEEIKPFYQLIKEDPDEDLQPEKFLAMMKEECAALEKALISALNKLPSFVGLVYRGDMLNELERQLIWSGTFKEKSVMSTSNRKEEVEKWVFRGATNTEEKYHAYFIIESKTGKNISELSANPHENEIVFMPGTSFKVVSYESMQKVIENQVFDYLLIKMIEI